MISIEPTPPNAASFDPNYSNILDIKYDAPLNDPYNHGISIRLIIHGYKPTDAIATI